MSASTELDRADAADDVMSFAFDGHVIRAILVDGEPWFVAGDIARALGYRDAHNMGRRLAADEKGTHSVSTPGGTQNVAIVSEPGLYVAILGSQVEGAQKFKRWVTREVLPAIRHTGSYGRYPAAPASAALPSKRELAQWVIEAEDRATKAEAEAKMLTAAIERDAPLVAKAEAHTANAKSINRQMFAREVQQWGTKQGINVLQDQVYEMLRRRGMLIDGHRSDRNHATSQAVKSGWAFTHKDVTEDGHPTAVTMINPRGQDIAWKWITEYVRENGNLVLPPKITGGAA